MVILSAFPNPLSLDLVRAKGDSGCRDPISPNHFTIIPVVQGRIAIAMAREVQHGKECKAKEYTLDWIYSMCISF
jgi:hypothetical protein